MLTTQYYRIAKILDIEITEEIEDIDNEAFDATEKSLSEFLIYLKSHIKLPCQLMSIKHFQWEDHYFFGTGTKTEYKELKKTRPSHTDIFNLVSFYGSDPDVGILVDVRRVSDNMEFTLPLVELEVVDKDSLDYQLVDDYSVWFKNS